MTKNKISHIDHYWRNEVKQTLFKIAILILIVHHHSSLQIVVHSTESGAQEQFAQQRQKLVWGQQNKLLTMV